jgi:single-stranded-DNA-specific exonuclease
LFLRQGAARARAVAFGMGELADELPGGAVVDLVFSPKINFWQGRRRAELHVQDFCPTAVPASV